MIHNAQGQASHHIDFLMSLLYLPTVADIQAAIKSNNGIRLKDLASAFDDLARSLVDNDRNEERQLLEFVYEIACSCLNKGNNEPLLVRDAGELFNAALNCTSALQIRRLLLSSRSLLDEETLKEWELEIADPRINLGSLAQRAVIFGIASLITGNPLAKLRGYLFWVTALRERGNIRSAERRLRQAILLAEASGDSSLLTMTRLSQVGLYRSLKNSPKALESMEPLFEIAKQDGNFALISTIGKGIAECCDDLGQYPKALDYINIVIPELESAGEAVWPILLECLQLRGLIEEHMGRYDRGLLDYERALTLAKALDDKGHQFVAMNNIAASFMKRGAHQESYRRFKEVLRVVSNWGNPAAVASTHNNIGNVLLQLDRPSEALAEFRKAFGYKINKGSKKGEIITLLGTADALYKLGEQESAETFDTMALIPILETHDPVSVGMYASRLLARAGKPDESVIGQLEWALHVVRVQHAVPMMIHLVAVLGDIYAKQGNKERALELYQEILSQSHKYSPLAPEFLRLQINYSSLLRGKKGGGEAAYKLLLEPLQLLEVELRETVYPERRGEIVDSTIKLFGALIEVLLERSDELAAMVGSSPIIRAYNLHEAAKSRNFLDKISDLPLPEPQNVPHRLLEQEAQLIALERSYQEAEEVESEVYRAERLGALKKELRACWGEIEKYAPQYVRMRLGEPYQYENISSNLFEKFGSNCAFVSFFCDASSTTAFVIRPGDVEPVVIRSKIGSVEIESATRDLLRIFNGSPHDFPPFPPIRRDKPFSRSLDFLDSISDSLLQFVPIVEGVEVICIAPHGPLHCLPFHALRLKDGSYLASKFAIVYAPSLSSMMQIGFKQPGKKEPSSVLVAGISAADDVRPEFFEQDQSIFDSKYDVVTRSGVEEVTRSHLIDLLPNYEIVHLSCHGYFDEANGLNSGLLVSDGQSKPPRNLSALSPIQRRPFTITVRDILKLRMSSELVTLNACSTGLQDERNAGDELDGFCRALLLAGSSSVLLTLWNVDQESSREFMAKFYQKWKDHDSHEKWRALHLVQQDFLASDHEYLRHPYHWAPFLLTGDWR